MPLHSSLHRTVAAAAVSIFTPLALLTGCTNTRFHNATAEPQYAVIDAAAVHDATPAGAKQRLVEGNARFVSGRMTHPQQTPQVRSELAGGQAPFAVILACADSRVGPEMVFDQGLGDLFVMRVAGNVIDDHIIGSIEYAVEHLHAPLIVVMGHSKCGAIAAAREVVAANGHAEGHVESLVQALRPAVMQTTDQDAEATCKANVRDVVKALRDSKPILQHMIEDGTVQVIGAYYDLATGEVLYLSER